MPIDKPSLVNQALTKLGPGAIFSEDDGSDLAKQVENAWDLTVYDAFSLHDWSWNRRTVKLDKLSPLPANGWPNGFMLPGDRIGPPLGFAERPGCTVRNFAIEGNAVFANVTTLYGKFNRVLDPSEWSLDFLDAFVTLLAGNLAIPVWQDANLKDQFIQEAVGSPSEKRSGGKFGRVKARDMSGEPVGDGTLMDDTPFDRARVTTSGPFAGPWHGNF